ncbi:hypothetical protein CsSME_00048586 [Camellia sinensis var. sinensis]
MEPPKAGADEAPKAGVEVKGDDDWVAPKTLVEVPPKMEPPVCEPKGVVLPKGLGANGLLLALLACPKTDWDPNGLLDDCPKGLLDPNIVTLYNSSVHGLGLGPNLVGGPELHAVDLRMLIYGSCRCRLGRRRWRW